MPALRRSIQRLAGLFAVIWLLGWPLGAAVAGPTPSWIPATQAPGHISPVGGVGVRARGKDLVIRGYVPRVQKGVAGFRVLETIRPDGAADLPRDRGAARAQEALAQVIDVVAKASLRPMTAERAVRLAMEGLAIGRAPDRSNLNRVAAARILKEFKDPYTHLLAPMPRIKLAGGQGPSQGLAPNAVSGHLRAGGIGVIDIRTFFRDGASAFTAAIDELTTQHGAPLRGLVIDLRHNGGGETSAALALADQLIAKGTLLRMSGRPQHPVQQIEATGTGLHTTVPLAVLTDGFTASSAEILARALQANGRARLFGERTFGKAVGQIVMPLSDRLTVRLTVSRHSDSAGTTWNKKGIKPDVDLRTILRAARGPSGQDPVLEHAVATLR